MTVAQYTPQSFVLTVVKNTSMAKKRPQQLSLTKAIEKDLKKEPAHAPCSPSSTKRILNCPGSPAMKLRAEKELPPPKPSPYAEEGLLAASIVDKILKAPKKREDILITVKDDEMRHHIDVYLDWLDTLTQSFQEKHAPVKVFSEFRVRYNDDIWGTLDFALAGKKEAVICDLKYGAGVEIDLSTDTQLLTYAVCLEKTLNVKFNKVHLFIYQPRIPGDDFQRVKVTREEIDAFEKRLTTGWKQSLKIIDTWKETGDVPADTLKRDDDWCRFCLAKTLCPAFLEHIRTDALAVLENEKPIPTLAALSVPQMIEIYQKKKVIEQFLKDVAGQLTYMAEQGIDVPGYKLVEGQKRRSWIDDEEKVAEELRARGVEHPYETKLIGITKVEREIGKGKIGDLTQYSTPKKELVPNDDERERLTIEAGLALLTDL